MFSRMASLGAIALGMLASTIPAPPPLVVQPSASRRNGRRGYINNPRGTVPNRGLKRIQGRQAARG